MKVSDGEEGEKKWSITDLFRKILEGLSVPVRQETVGWVDLASCPEGPLTPGPALADIFYGSCSPSPHPSISLICCQHRSSRPESELFLETSQPVIRSMAAF